ncbi:hypothetical protein [Burkholderia sp. BDU5]|uniref:hypothetical protein n=1 Tax=Burkholderia sp. BDU5 TaxID=1385590 RepID=UPI0012E3BAF3|nr:hypothetical protein [Burkholderia sp. BDU5]
MTHCLASWNFFRHPTDIPFEGTRGSRLVAPFFRRWIDQAILFVPLQRACFVCKFQRAQAILLQRFEAAGRTSERFIESILHDGGRVVGVCRRRPAGDPVRDRRLDAAWFSIGLDPGSGFEHNVDRVGTWRASRGFRGTRMRSSELVHYIARHLVRLEFRVPVRTQQLAKRSEHQKFALIAFQVDVGFVQALAVGLNDFILVHQIQYVISIHHNCRDIARPSLSRSFERLGVNATSSAVDALRIAVYRKGGLTGQLEGLDRVSAVSVPLGQSGLSRRSVHDAQGWMRTLYDSTMIRSLAEMSTDYLQQSRAVLFEPDPGTISSNGRPCE